MGKNKYAKKTIFDTCTLHWEAVTVFFAYRQADG